MNNYEIVYAKLIHVVCIPVIKHVIQIQEQISLILYSQPLFTLDPNLESLNTGHDSPISLV